MNNIPALVQTDDKGRIQKIKVLKDDKQRIAKKEGITTTEPVEIVRTVEKPVVQTFKSNEDFRKHLLKQFNPERLVKELVQVL